MDFELSDRQRHWRDRVRDFIDRHVAPRMDEYHAEQASGDRWKVLQVIEEAAALGCNPAASEEAAVRGLDCERVREALLRLPVEYREAVVLHYHEECSMREVASALGLSLSGAKMRVGRGLRRLRALVLGGGHE